MNKINLLLVILAILLLSNCMREDLNPTPQSLYDSKGVFIVNEGNYLYANSSLSFYNMESGEVINEIFFKANARPLGDVANSMFIRDSLGYIVINNSGRIQVVDINTMLHVGTIEGFTSPRHMLFLSDDLALVSDLYARGVSVVNPKEMAITGFISTGSQSMPYYQHSTENLIKVGNKVFTNCWSFDNKLLVICTEELSVADSIEVGIQPLSIAKDSNDNIWVMNDGGYDGNPVGHEPPSLMRVNTNTLEVELRLNFPSLAYTAGQIATNPTGDSLYFICNNLYKMPINSQSIPDEPLVNANGKIFRSLAVHPQTGELFISDAIDYMSEGKVYRYSPVGALIDTVDVGIIPGNFCFN